MTHGRDLRQRRVLGKQGRDEGFVAVKLKATPGWRSAASAAPSMVTAGPLSPPMASTEIISSCAKREPDGRTRPVP